jgi:beta-glucosidase
MDIPALLAALTVEEKVSLLDGADFWRTQGIERLGIPPVTVTDGPHGLRK